MTGPIPNSRTFRFHRLATSTQTPQFDNDWRISPRRTKLAKNADLWERLLAAYERHEVEMVWVKGHARLLPRPPGEGCGDGTPVVKRTPKKRAIKANQAYYFAWYLYCPACKSMYMVEQAH